MAQIAMVPELRAVLGPELVGSVVDGQVESTDPGTGLAQIRVGHSAITASGAGLRAGQPVRLQVLARDLILATQRPTGLSVRNEIEGTIRAIVDDGREAVLVEIDVGGPVLLARVTRPAASDLALEPGRRVWVLVKATPSRSWPRSHWQAARRRGVPRLTSARSRLRARDLPLSVVELQLDRQLLDVRGQIEGAVRSRLAAERADRQIHARHVAIRELDVLDARHQADRLVCDQIAADVIAQLARSRPSSSR